MVDVENHQILHTLELKGEIVSLNWTQNTKESYDDFDDLQGNTKLVRSFIQPKIESISQNQIRIVSVCKWSQSLFAATAEFQFINFEYTKT